MIPITLAEHRRIHAEMGRKNACRARMEHVEDPWGETWIMTTPTQHHPPEGPVWFHASNKLAFRGGIARHNGSYSC